MNANDRIPTLAFPAVTPGRKLSLTLVFGVVVISVFALQIVSLPEQTRLWKEILNAGHVLLFGVLSTFILWTSSELFSHRIKERHQHYLIALVTTVAIGALTEIMQLWTPRDANLADFARNIAGAACFLGLYSMHDSRLTGSWKTKPTREIVTAASVVTLLAVFVPLLGWTAAYAHRSYTFPKIVSFESYWGRMFLDTQDADLIITDPPPRWTAAHSHSIARLTLKPAEYPGLRVMEPYPDWSGYGFLRFDIYSEMRSPIRLALRVHDWWHNNAYADRFNYRLTVLPGPNSFKIPMDTIRKAPVGRELDMRHIAALALFARNPQEPYAIDIDGMWLE